MKNTVLIILAALMMTSCYKEEIPDKHTLSGAGSNGGSGSTTGSHYCGYPTKAAVPVNVLYRAVQAIAGSTNKS